MFQFEVVESRMATYFERRWVAEPLLYRAWTLILMLVEWLAHRDHHRMGPTGARADAWQDIEMGLRGQAEPIVAGAVLELFTAAGEHRRRLLGVWKSTFNKAWRATDATYRGLYTPRNRAACMVLSAGERQQALPVRGARIHAIVRRYTPDNAALIIANLDYLVEAIQEPEAPRRLTAVERAPHLRLIDGARGEVP